MRRSLHGEIALEARSGNKPRTRHNKLGRRVVGIRQSPLNDHRWMLSLACGHELWVTAKRRPKRQTIRCSVCNPLGRVPG